MNERIISSGHLWLNTTLAVRPSKAGSYAVAWHLLYPVGEKMRRLRISLVTFR